MNTSLGFEGGDRRHTMAVAPMMGGAHNIFAGGMGLPNFGGVNPALAGLNLGPIQAIGGTGIGTN